MPIKEIEKKSLALNALDKIHLIEELFSSLDKGSRLLLHQSEV